MCDPLTAGIALAVGGVVQTGASIVSANQTANAQEAAIRGQQERVLEENRRAASGEMFDQMRAARREQGRIRTASGEAGLGLAGGSIEGLLMDSAMQMELKGSRTLANMESRNAATNAEAESMLSQIQRPSAVGAGLQMASSAASGWAGVQNTKLALKRSSDV